MHAPKKIKTNDKGKAKYLGVDFLLPLSILPSSTTLSSEVAQGSSKSVAAFGTASVDKLTTADFLLLKGQKKDTLGVNELHMEINANHMSL